MKLRALFLLPVSLALAGAGAAHAGRVEVVFADPASYADAGAGAAEQDANLRQIARYLGTLGERWLPPGQTLAVEVLEVDLAGALRPRPDGSELRVVTGGADFPRLHLRYRLTGDGVQRSGEEHLADLDYRRGIVARADPAPLFHEKRMILAWFQARFVNGRDD